MSLWFEDLISEVGISNKDTMVTSPSLPPLDELMPYLNEIWETRQLTNNGKFHQEFEERLAEYLGVRYVSLFTNGTSALITALKALDIKGEVITTPFSFVATTHSLAWGGIKPVFVDIKDFNIDVNKIESAITSKTTAILPVHTFGFPCDVKKIQEIADRNGLKVIYDAAHSFGVKLNGKSILNFGDLSVLSFHATKVFNTFEGGAIISHDLKTKQKIDYLKNFGIKDENTTVGIGINSKMNEFQSALGLVQLNYIDSYIAKRHIIAQIYRNSLKSVPLKNDVEYNYSYFPILVDNRDELYDRLKKHNIHTRKYFSLISNLPMYKTNGLPIANDISNRVLCLPIYPHLKRETVLQIIRIINE